MFLGIAISGTEKSVFSPIDDLSYCGVLFCQNGRSFPFKPNASAPLL